MRDKSIFFVVYLIFGVYLLNKFFNFWNLPEVVLKYEGFVFLIAGILIILSSINFLKRRGIQYRKNKYLYR